MEKIDFTQNGGYRMKQSTFKKMQDGYFEILAAFVSALGIPNIGNYIISGCNVSGPNISDGFMFIDGELCPFYEIPGNNDTKIKKLEVFQSVAFKNGSNPPVWKTTTAVEDSSGIKLSDFTRVNLVIDSNYVHTDNNFTALLLAKLNGIEAGAEVNVQADWNVSNPASDAYIKNKPQILNVIKIGSVILDDFPNSSSETRNITFPDVGTSNYIVLGSMESRLPFAAALPDLIVWTTSGYSETSFRLLGRELGSGTQNLKFNYILIGI